MNKTLRFSRFSTKRRLIQYGVILTLIVFGSVYTFRKVSFLLNERRIKLIAQYQEEVTSLQEDKKENLKRLEMEYDKKIEKLLTKIEELKNRSK